MAKSAAPTRTTRSQSYTRTPRKRSREPEEEQIEEPSSKRHQAAVTPANASNLPFPFNRQQQRSAITSLPAGERRNGRPKFRQHPYATPSRKFANHNRDLTKSRASNPSVQLFEDFPSMSPPKSTHDPETSNSRDSTSNTSNSAGRPSSRSSEQNSWFGSVKRLLGLASKTPEIRDEPTQAVTNGINIDRLEVQVRVHTDDDDISQSSETESSTQNFRSHQFNDASTTPQPRRRQIQDTPVPNRRSNRLQRHDLGTPSTGPSNVPNDKNTNLPLQETAANIIPSDSQSARKRKLASVDGQIPGPRRGGFGVDDSYLDIDNEVDGIDESLLGKDNSLQTPPNKKQKIIDQSPLKSALKSGTRSGMSVGFANNLATSRAIYGVHGRAGDYKGSTFSEGHSFTSDSSASFDGRTILSPQTMSNTFENQGRAVENSSPSSSSTETDTEGRVFRVDTTVRDPNNPDWHPTVSNPRPGSFRVPDYFDVDPDEMPPESPEMSETSETPPVPQAPRMSHVELPTQTPSATDSNQHSEDSSTPATELKLNRARSEAQRYKPRDSSRLSRVEQARSRSSSPPSSTITQVGTELSNDGSTTNDPNTTLSDGDTTPTRPRELDNTIRGQDGMTDFEREHQHDRWAQGLDWPTFQTYEESGVGSEYITKLIADRWNEDDNRRSHEFWQREFDIVEKAMNDAKARGLTLELLTGED